MGQHKHNPTAIAAKEGKLPPKPPKMSTREREALAAAIIAEKTGINEIRRTLRRCGIKGEY